MIYSFQRSRRSLHALNEDYHITAAADLTVVETLNQHHLNQRISTAAKTIIYLFSPEIDLIEHLSNNIEQYDKYKKTKLILKELMNCGNQDQEEFQMEVLRTRQALVMIEGQLEKFKAVVSKLEDECRQKENIIQEQKSSLIKLTEAYSQAKTYWQDEINSLQGQLLSHQQQQMTIKINGQKKSQETPQSLGTSQKSSRLLVPKQSKKRRQSQAYTDRSMYIRFKAGHSIDSKQSQRSYSQKKYKADKPESTFKLQHLAFEKEALERKLTIIEEQYKLLSVKHQEQQSKFQERLKLIQKQLEEQKKINQLSQSKIAEKNRLINQLLLVIEGDQS